jgi:hypothetical protein
VQDKDGMDGGEVEIDVVLVSSEHKAVMVMAAFSQECKE